MDSGAPRPLVRPRLVLASGGWGVHSFCRTSVGRCHVAGGAPARGSAASFALTGLAGTLTDPTRELTGPFCLGGQRLVTLLALPVPDSSIRVTSDRYGNLFPKGGESIQEGG